MTYNQNEHKILTKRITAGGGSQKVVRKRNPQNTNTIRPELQIKVPARSVTELGLKNESNKELLSQFLSGRRVSRKTISKLRESIEQESLDSILRNTNININNNNRFSHSTHNIEMENRDVYRMMKKIEKGNTTLPQKFYTLARKEKQNEHTTERLEQILEIIKNQIKNYNKALKKITEYIKKQSKPSAIRSMFSFIVPLPKSLLTTEERKKVKNLSQNLQTKRNYFIKFYGKLKALFKDQNINFEENFTIGESILYNNKKGVVTNLSNINGIKRYSIRLNEKYKNKYEFKGINSENLEKLSKTQEKLNNHLSFPTNTLNTVPKIKKYLNTLLQIIRKMKNNNNLNKVSLHKIYKEDIKTIFKQIENKLRELESAGAGAGAEARDARAAANTAADISDSAAAAAATARKAADNAVRAARAARAALAAAPTRTQKTIISMKESQIKKLLKIKNDTPSLPSEPEEEGK